MKQTVNVILGALIFILAFVYLFAMTYLFDYFAMTYLFDYVKGNDGREFVVIMASVFGGVGILGFVVYLLLKDAINKMP